MKRNDILLNGIVYIFLVSVALVCLIPYIWIVLASMKNNTELFNYPFLPPKKWLVDNYLKAWVSGRFGKYYKNTIVITALSVGILIPVAVLAAFPFAKMQFYGKKLLLYLVLFGLIIPFQAYMISVYYTLKTFRLLNTYMAMVLPLVAVHIPFSIFYMRAFLSGLPAELMDAAKVDGCNVLQTIGLIVVPMSKAAITSLGIFQCVLSWNAFMIPLLYVQKEAIRPITLGLMYFRGEYETSYDLSAAGAVIISIPLICIFLIFRRGFIRGLAGGAFK